MAVKTVWPVDHVCGHAAEVDLSARPADQRAGYARWLAGRDCADCWQAARTGDAEAAAERIAVLRAAQAGAARAWEGEFRMPSLEGSERAVAWGARCRHQLVTAAYAVLVTEGTTSEAKWAEVEDAVRPVTRAGWWIDQRDADPADLPELLAAAGGADRPTENPHF
ncbi:hypothetical protein [Streptomyces clavuligerus]|uniref:Uncharacterized protein n=1 Tax=Streptomyces clavuligerus TaxID=1901 RepID=E2Q8T6_STRCL|nr:hypothetical protein [Streptomyces clavuligerus]ANW19608.1 hypothetical protein BB341_15965 [Streptomyces clavuligerus]AXU14213.1 hypothetical protein D1794_16645 [Streptomyces clavuligerus]EFG07574.1 Hypothetical protein SCLAV_2502 [Streptomyces clavuligerus]MBY6304213.1 hypothetical protein [Streptomyces clavuligerus]QCS06987.1 hypothetical protein CRV15_16000 [Streptomyces clavuligerus]